MIYFNGKRHGNAAVTITEGDGGDSYDKGYDDGYQHGYNEGEIDGTAVGIEQGKEAQQKAFWDTYQQNGNRAHYTYAFYGAGWTDETYNPIYTIKPTSGCNGMFNVSDITDTKVPIDLTAINNNSQAFAYATRLVTINKVIFAADVAVESNCFAWCSKLENITVEGTLGCNMSFSDSPLLSAESVLSIVEHLKIFLNTDDDDFVARDLTLKTDAWNNFVAVVPPEDGVPSWNALVQSKGWNLVLV